VRADREPVAVERHHGVNGAEGADQRREGRAVTEAVDERSLVVLACAGDVAAFESLVRRRMNAIYRLDLAILGDEADAADAAQETFISAWRALAGLRDVDSFEAWLHRVSVNACRILQRARGRRLVREMPMAELSAAAEVPAREPADVDLLRAALKKLSHDHRTVLALHHLEGRPVKEIAEALGIPEGTAKSRLFKARAALDRAIGEEAQR
jgi:RNA polymerase sigma-70 factor (ECF subfamily)